MNIIVIILICFSALFYSLFKYVYGLLQTHPNMVFLGTVHHPSDYFIYLAEFAEGKTHWLTSVVLQSTDFPKETMVRWVNVFWGHVWSLVGMGPIESYQLTNVIFTVILMILSYLVLKELINRSAVPLAIFLYVTANAFPLLTQHPGGITFGSYDFWYNMGNPFNRFITIPHHLIGQCAILTIIIVSLWWQKKRFTPKLRHILLILTTLSGLTLGGINAVHLLFITGLIILTGFMLSIFHKPVSIVYILKNTLYLSLPAATAIVGGIPVIVHLKQILSIPPYSQMITWEATHQLYLTYVQFILGYGPVMVIAPIGLYFFIKKPTYGTIMAILITTVGIGLYFSHIPEQFMLGKVRFLPPIINLFLCAMTAIGTRNIMRGLPKGRPLFAIIIGVSYAALTIPTFIAQIQDMTRHYHDPNNASYYITTANYKIMLTARDTSDPNDIFLVQWPFNTVFPGLTARRTYFSEALLATDAHIKSNNIFSFFYRSWSSPQMREFLHKNGITRVIGFSQNLPPDDDIGLVKISQANGFALWRVRN